QNARPDELMPMQLIQKIVDELADLNYDGRFEPYVYNEPFRDPRLLDIVRLVAARVPKACIMISTNGDYLKSKAQVAAVFEAGVRQLMINIYSAADGSPHARTVASGIRNAEARAEKFQRWID